MAQTDSPTKSAPTNLAALDQAFVALGKYSAGSSRGVLMPIDQAVVESLAHPSERDRLEERLFTLLSSDISAVAKEYICRKLALFGSARSVPALTRLLDDSDLGQGARAALEAIPGQESGDALRTKAPHLGRLNKIGVINSLLARPEANNIPVLTPLLDDADPLVVSAAAAALGEIGTLTAAEILNQFYPRTSAPTRQAVADARLVCAERLLIAGHKPEAQTIYQSLASSDQAKPIQLAAKRGLLRVLQQQ